MARRLNLLAACERSVELRALEIESCRRSVHRVFDNWIWTYDPRSAGTGRPAYVPMSLYPRQREMVSWFEEREREQNDGVLAKSRDTGFTWCAGGFAYHRWRFVNGYKVAFGSRKAELVDKLGDPDSIFEKIRMLLRLLPTWLLPPGFSFDVDAKHDLIRNPENNNTIRGEAGNDMGRGGRASMYFLDEFAFVEHQEAVDAATLANTDVRIFGSSANGPSNLFATKWTSEVIKASQKFRIHYTDDPRRTPEWAEKKRAQSTAVNWASEYEIDFTASVTGVLIPPTWVDAAIGALKKLGIHKTGLRAGALDVADEGADFCSYVGATGVEIDRVEEWSGKGSDIYTTVERAFGFASADGHASVRYDGDGLGAGVRGDANRINDERRKKGERQIAFEAFRGSAAVVHPERPVEEGSERKNEDFFSNFNAQAAWEVRRRFLMTYRAIVEGQPVGGLKGQIKPEEIISIDPGVGNLLKLKSEISRPTYSVTKAGKIEIDKSPDGTPSPNLWDALKIRFAPLTLAQLNISDDALGAFRSRMIRR